MSQDITEACPLFCLVEMVCVLLKDLLKREKEREKTRTRESEELFSERAELVI